MAVFDSVRFCHVLSRLLAWDPWLAGVGSGISVLVWPVAPAVERGVPSLGDKRFAGAAGKMVLLSVLEGA